MHCGRTSYGWKSLRVGMFYIRSSFFGGHALREVVMSLEDMTFGRTYYVGRTGLLQVCHGLCVCLPVVFWCSSWSIIVIVHIVEHRGVHYGVMIVYIVEYCVWY